MPFDGSGNFTRVHDFEEDRNNGIKILASRMDAEFDNLSTGLNSTFLRTGLVAMSGDLNLGLNRVTQIADGAVASPAMRFGSDTNSGIYLDGYNRPSISVNGVRRLTATTTGVDVNGVLTASGAITLSSTLAVTGNTTVGGTLGVTGVVTLSSTLAVASNATVGGTLGVTGASTLGVTTISSLGVTTNATVGGTLGVTSNATVGGTLGVTGISTLAGTNITGTVNVTGTVNATALGVASNATVGGTLGVTGAVTLSSTLVAAGNIVSSGELVARGTVGEGGQISLGYTGNTTMTGTTNSTWNMDVDGSNNLRVFRINAGGAASIPLSINEAGNTITSDAGTLWLLTNKLFINHDGTDGFIRAQTGNMNLGSAGATQLTLTSASAVFNVAVVGPTAAWGTATTQLATTAFVDRLRGIPSSSAGAQTLTAAARGTCIKATGTQTINTGVFAADDTVTVYADQAGTVTLTPGAGMTMRLAGTATTGARTLAGRGFATVYFVGGSECVVSGNIT